MLSQKNKNKSFVYEEELDQETIEKISIKNESTYKIKYSIKWAIWS